MSTQTNQKEEKKEKKEKILQTIPGALQGAFYCDSFLSKEDQHQAYSDFTSLFLDKKEQILFGISGKFFFFF